MTSTIKRRSSRTIKVGKLKIGGNQPIAIQTMLMEALSSPKSCIDKINQLKFSSCDLVRIAVKNKNEIPNIKSILNETTMPIVADIQFNWEHAVAAIKNGFHGVRVNPGYISDKERLKNIIDLAGEYDCAIRIGYNSGSLPKDVLSLIHAGEDRSKAILASVQQWCEFLETRKFLNYKLSIKSSSVLETIKLNSSLTDITKAPLHLGVTEAGIYDTALIRSSIAFGVLLLNGIGDTIRVSITGDPLEEVESAKEILRSLGLYNKGIKLVSCPTCSRCAVNLETFARDFAKFARNVDKPLTIAIMGCSVNGPGEARQADFGISGGAKGKMTFFKKGKVISALPANEAMNILKKEVENYEA